MRSARDIVLRTVRVLNGQPIKPLLAPVNIVTILGYDRRRVHLYTLCPKVEFVAVVIEEPQETIAKVIWLLAVLEVADDKTDDGEASDTACMDLVHATHDKELLQKSNHVYHVWIIVFPLLKRCLGLDSAKILKGDINVDIGHSIHELDDRYLGLRDAQHIRGNAYILEPPGSFSQCRVDDAFVAKIHGCWATLVESIGSVDKVHICSRQVQSGRERAEAQNAPSVLRKSLSTQSLLHSLNKSVSDVVLVRLGRNEVVEVEDLIMQPVRLV